MLRFFKTTQVDKSTAKTEDSQKRTVGNKDAAKTAASEESAEEKRPVSFVLEFKQAEPKRAPSRLSADSRGRKKTRALVEYTDDEAMLIADILRESHIDEKKKASSTDIKLYDASRRRMCLNHIKEQATKSNNCLQTADISERRQRVKEMAIAARRRAVEERGSNKPLAVACSIDR